MYSAAIVRFNKDHDYEVYSARVAAGLPVRQSQVVEHRMVGRVVIVNGKRFFVEAAYKHWSQGYYVNLLINNFNDSHANITFETIGNCYDDEVLSNISKRRSDTIFTLEVVGEKEQKKIKQRLQIDQLLYSDLVRKSTDWKEEYAMVEKAGLITH